jgi:23S rRNA (uridine2552-2'-O)-methyltransferase
VTYRRRDPFHRRARAEGYRARSAYKLLELDGRFRLLRRGDFVVDLGAWPGGWLQVVLDRIGPEGRVVGVDVAPVRSLGAANLLLLRGDVRDPSIARSAADYLGRPGDVVLSDLAPKLSGIRVTDEARCLDLGETALALLPVLLRPGGRFVIKLFTGPETEAFLGRLAGEFRDLKVTRPEATRRGSAEVYGVGLGYRGTRDPDRTREPNRGSGGC